jgi:hypothetical protein
MSRGIEDRFAARHRASQNAGIFTDVCSKYIAALPAQGFTTAYFYDLLRRPIESSNSPLQIDRENALVDRVQYCSLPAI